MRHYTGSIEVICGSMFSGKSSELARRLKLSVIAKQNVQAFKPKIDIRYSKNNVVSHDGTEFSAQSIESASDILNLMDKSTTVIGVDEAQFLDEKIIEVVEKLADKGIRVIIAGLDTDFRGEPFGPMPELLARAEKVDKYRAICTVCGDEACRTQRIIDGEPADYHSPIIEVGAKEMYEARCRKHHQVPNKPK